jgi:hypothetical protein
VVLAARTARLGELGRVPRVAASLAVLVLALTPALFALSQPSVTRALDALAVRDCGTAIDAALNATERFGVRPEPWMVLGYCDARLGQNELARRAMDAAIVYGVSGLDPRPYAEEALRLNPLDPRVRALVRDLRRANTAARRREITGRAPIPLD